jgi:hypothetical protein
MSELAKRIGGKNINGQCNLDPATRGQYREIAWVWFIDHELKPG